MSTGIKMSAPRVINNKPETINALIALGDTVTCHQIESEPFEVLEARTKKTSTKGVVYTEVKIKGLRNQWKLIYPKDLLMTQSK
jgi:hypothetical protein